MHTSITPRSHEGLRRGVHLAGWVDAGGAFHWASPCSCHCQRSGAAWHSRAQTRNHTEAVTGIACVCIGCFGLLNLEATLLSVIAHLPEIPPRTTIWAWITFIHTAVCVWGLISSGLPKAPWWSSTSFYFIYLKTAKIKLPWRPNNRRASLPDPCSASMQLQLYCAEWRMTWQQVGLSEGRTQQVRWEGLLRYPWGTALGREDETWHGVDFGANFLLLYAQVSSTALPAGLLQTRVGSCVLSGDDQGPTNKPATEPNQHLPVHADARNHMRDQHQ